MLAATRGNVVVDTFFWQSLGAGAPPLHIRARKTTGPEPDTWYELTVLDEDTHMGVTRLVSRQELRSLRNSIEKLVETESDAREPLDETGTPDATRGADYADRVRAHGGTLSIAIRFIPTSGERDRIHAGLRALEEMNTFSVAVLQQAIDHMAARAEFPVWLYLEEYHKLAQMPGLNWGQWFGLATWKLLDMPNA